MYLSQYSTHKQILLHIDSKKYFAIVQASVLALSLYCCGSVQNGYFIASMVDNDEIYNDLKQVLAHITFDECLKRCDQLIEDNEKVYEQAYLFAVTKYFSHSLGFTSSGKKRMKSEFASRRVYEYYAVSFFEAAEKVIDRLSMNEYEMDIPHFLAYEAIELIKE